jgi:3-oxoacyl-[acyl-carrier-protein] synthase II
MRVFITGIGMVSPLGIGREHNWQSILDSRTNVQQIPEHWYQYTDYFSDIWSPLPEINFAEHGFKRSEIIQRDSASLLAMMTTQEALEHAGIQTSIISRKSNQYSLPELDAKRVGVHFGTGMGGANAVFNNLASHLVSRARQQLGETGSEPLDNIKLPLKFNPFVVPMCICNSIPASIGIKYALHGAMNPVVQACSSGTSATGQAYKAIAAGQADMIITGGVEQLGDEHGYPFHGFDSARTLTPAQEGVDINTRNRPFDADRSGFLFAAGGSATLILESETHLEKRGATPIAEICGYAETFDAYSIMAPDPDMQQVERMINIALDEAGIHATDIDYINAHGTGTVANDAAEASVIERVFGREVAVNSTKSILGHTIGASGAIEAAVCALSLRDQELHASLNIDKPIADIDLVSQRRKAELNYAFSQSFAFGGHNSALVIKAV